MEKMSEAVRLAGNVIDITLITLLDRVPGYPYVC